MDGPSQRQRLPTILQFPFFFFQSPVVRFGYALHGLNFQRRLQMFGKLIQTMEHLSLDQKALFAKGQQSHNTIFVCSVISLALLKSLWVERKDKEMEVSVVTQLVQTRTLQYLMRPWPTRTGGMPPPRNNASTHCPSLKLSSLHRALLRNRKVNRFSFPCH